MQQYHIIHLCRGCIEDLKEYNPYKLSIKPIKVNYDRCINKTDRGKFVNMKGKRKMSKDKLRRKFEERLNGDRICDFISRKEEEEFLNVFNKWLETAQTGDVYYYDGEEYELEIEYEIHVWKNGEQREHGEPTYMTPISSDTDLDAIKKECEAYDIESTGCIEIFEVDEYDAIWHYENGKWTEVES